MNILSGSGLDIDLLEGLLARPPLYQRSNHYIWTDPHVSRSMLDFHLDPDLDSASLRHSAIEEQSRWIARKTGGRGRRLLDIGCGPGLYCEWFHTLGFAVTGMDFNPNSLDYARNHAAEASLSIEYVYGNYVEMDRDGEFDVITLINRDFGALTVAERDRLLQAVHRALDPGGCFVFDVLSLEYLRRHGEASECQVSSRAGFWSSRPHLVVERRYVYAEANAHLELQVVVEEDGTVRDFRNWLTYYSRQDLEDLLRSAGFSVVETNPFLSDREYDDPELYVGVVAVKP